MKCPVCKTECYTEKTCSECGFDGLQNAFLSKEEGELWMQEVVCVWRRKYWDTLEQFEIQGKELIRYSGQDEVVVIPYGVEKIGTDAFYDADDVRRVFFPDTLSCIGKFAFHGSPVISVDLPYGIEKIEGSAFENSSLRSIVIPGTCKVIEECAFCGCDDLEYAMIMPGVQRIGYNAFAQCEKLKILSIPATVSDIAESAFPWTSELMEVRLDPRNTQYQIKEGCLVDVKSGSIISGFACKTVPSASEIKRIGEHAYGGWSNPLTCEKFVIPQNITEIGEYAFSFAQIKKVLLTKQKRKIHPNAFLAMEYSTFFCDVEKDEIAQTEGWCKKLGKGCQVFWANEWMPYKSEPEIVLMHNRDICATMVSCQYDTSTRSINLSIRVYSGVHEEVKFSLTNIAVDGITSRYSHTCSLESWVSDRMCSFKFDSPEFERELPESPEKIEFGIIVRKAESGDLVSYNAGKKNTIFFTSY